MNGHDGHELAMDVEVVLSDDTVIASAIVSGRNWWLVRTRASVRAGGTDFDPVRNGPPWAGGARTIPMLEGDSVLNVCDDGSIELWVPYNPC